MSKKSNRYKRLLAIEKSKDPNQTALDRLSQIITGRRAAKLIVRSPHGDMIEFSQCVVRKVNPFDGILEFEAFTVVVEESNRGIK